MGQRWDQFLTGLGTQAAPFGFAPGVDPKTAGMNVIGGIGANMLSNITKNPLEAFGGAYKQQMEDSRDQSRDALSAKVVMDQMEEKKRERAAEQEQKAQMERMIGMLPPDQQALARMMPDKFFGAQIQNQFGEGKAKPAAIQEYEYAKSQGFPGTFQDWEASKKGGMSLQVDPDTGAVTFQQGNIKPMTESQSKDTVFATRAEGALKKFDPVADALTGYGDTAAGSVPVIGNAMVSQNFQLASQSGKEFLQAILRKDTGAAITPAETAEYGSVYLPRPGDGPAVLLQKKASRQRAVAALKAGMTPQAILAQEKALLGEGQAQPIPNPIGGGGTTSTGVPWKVLP